MNLFLKTKDYAVSKESFQLNYNSDLDMLETFPQPKSLESYYESDAYISHTDSNQGFVDTLYQFVKKYSLKKKVALINSFAAEQKTVLDFGAGTGDFLVVAKENGWDIQGIEPNVGARSKAKAKNIVLSSDIQNITCENKLSVITLWHVLEHLPNLDVQIENILKCLDKNGTLIIAVPNFKSFDAVFYKEHWAAYDVPRHLWHFSRNSMDLLFQKHNMKVVKTKPMIFDSFYVSLLSEKYKTGNQNFLKAFSVGLWSNLKALFNREHSSVIYILKSK